MWYFIFKFFHFFTKKISNLKLRVLITLLIQSPKKQVNNKYTFLNFITATCILESFYSLFLNLNMPTY